MDKFRKVQIVKEERFKQFDVNKFNDNELSSISPSLSCIKCIPPFECPFLNQKCFLIVHHFNLFPQIVIYLFQIHFNLFTKNASCAWEFLKFELERIIERGMVEN